jgi:glycosyltransferase involved in cell wall biosynthesis
MKRTGQQSSVLNIDPRAPESDEYIKVAGGLDLARQLVRHVGNDWTLKVHINGHNPKSWTIALACGVAAQFGPGASLTLHSGMAPAYIRTAPEWMRRIIRMACVLYRPIVCVNEEIADAVAGLGVAQDNLEITPAFLPTDAPDVELPPDVENWVREHSPVVTSTMFFRPEYGFELLVKAVERLKEKYSRIGCLVMGSGEDRDQAGALVEKYGLGGTIYLAGDLSHELCLALMARSLAFVRPTFRDGDSISVREAVALGVPVIASNVGTRPAGVRLFPAGDVARLVEQIEASLGPPLCGSVGAVCDRAYFGESRKGARS